MSKREGAVSLEPWALTVMPLLVVCAAGALAAEVPRPEHPQPQCVRDVWMNLNGQWEFEFDDADVGLKENWVERGALGKHIVVPFPFQGRLSGIGDTGFHHVMWYRRTFEAPPDFAGKGVLLHFGAVDYEARIWLNGREIGSHRGGHVPFIFEITDQLKPGANTLVVRAVDTESRAQPRGKQSWKLQSSGIRYTRTSGIWQTVWLEGVGQTYIKSFYMTPSVDAQALDLEFEVDGPAREWAVEVVASFGGAQVASLTTKPGQTRASIAIPEPRLWTPEEPNLYDIAFTLRAGDEILDRVRSYFGMRKISVADNRLLLNDRPYFQRLVLDQGYWPDGILTAPSDEALGYDIEMAKRFGFNGARKHQKVEDPRWLYWADRLGFLLWGEMANAYEFTPASCETFEAEWPEAVKRDYNHPCVVAWTPFNESWGIEGVENGVEQQRFVERIYNLTKRLDPYRPICDNSGWMHTLTDIADFHDYVEKGDGFREHWAEFERQHHRAGLPYVFFVNGKSYMGQPIVVSEYGGITLRGFEAPQGSERVGYGTHMQDEKAFLARYRDITSAIQDIEEIQGFCYTQLTDIEQEVNGVMTYDRKPKVAPGKIAEINLRRR
jgi:beta-galactosidase/beta-glucuronidase